MLHPFERAGLGKAPFRFSGLVAQDLAYGEAILNRDEFTRTGVAITTKPGGSCAYCGTYILNMYNIESADGRRFHVGSDCVLKTAGDPGADKKLISAVTRKRNELNKKTRAAREAEKIAEAMAFLERADVRAFVESQPSPNAWRASQGDTLADYVAFAWRNAGTAARLRQVAKVREAFARNGSAQ